MQYLLGAFGFSRLVHGMHALGYVCEYNVCLVVGLNLKDTIVRLFGKEVVNTRQKGREGARTSHILFFLPSAHFVVFVLFHHCSYCLECLFSFG